MYLYRRIDSKHKTATVCLSPPGELHDVNVIVRG